MDAQSSRFPAVVMSLTLLALAACSAPPSTPMDTDVDTPAPTLTPVAQVTHSITYASPLHPEASEQRLDVYAPNEAGPWPIMILMHGLGGTKEFHMPESQAIAAQGVVVYTVNWPTPVADIATQENGRGFREIAEVLTCAVRFARSTAPEYGGDPSQGVVLVGFSYGAEMGAWVAFAGDDLAPAWEAFTAGRGGPEPQVECAAEGGSASVDAFIGIGGSYEHMDGLRERDAELWEVVSLFAYLEQAVDLPVRIVHGERDSTVNADHSVEFNDVLAESGYDTRLVMFDGFHQVPDDVTAELVFELVGE
jgi:predicted esterase